MKVISYDTIGNGEIYLQESNELDSTCGISDEEHTERLHGTFRRPPDDNGS